MHNAKIGKEAHGTLYKITCSKKNVRSKQPKVLRRNVSCVCKDRAIGYSSIIKGGSDCEKGDAEMFACGEIGISHTAEVSARSSATEYSKKISFSEKNRKKDCFFTQKTFFFPQKPYFCFRECSHAQSCPAASRRELPQGGFARKYKENTMKLWEKTHDATQEIDSFTVGNDRKLDLLLAPYDALGSMAHATMLEHIGLLKKEELSPLLCQLRAIYQQARDGKFAIAPDVEDVHSQIELTLARKLGPMGKKIHSGRSRNDQVLLDLKLFTRDGIRKVAAAIKRLFNKLQEKSEQYKDVGLPGYTHLQVAMPSSFGLWFGAYAESLSDDLTVMQAAWAITNRNPLGSAAGYGSSFPIDREMTTRLLGFDTMDYNVVYAQMCRGKMERVVSASLAQTASTLSKLAFDCCLYNSQNFSFIKLPDECTTGSSIMPHKKNPDVFELIRARCNRLQALPCELTLITSNLPSGYFRDLQELKEAYLPAFTRLSDCLDMATYAIERIKVNPHITDDTRYDNMYSVEEVNRLVLAGIPFRDAYRKVGIEIEEGTFHPHKQLRHTHQGSSGNLCNDQIKRLMEQTWQKFRFEKVEQAERELLLSADQA